MAKQRHLRPGDVLADDEAVVVRVGVLRAAGLRLEPTGRNPRQFTVAFDDLDAGIERLCRCEHQRWVNPYPGG